MAISVKGDSLQLKKTNTGPFSVVFSDRSEQKPRPSLSLSPLRISVSLSGKRSRRYVLEVKQLSSVCFDRETPKNPEHIRVSIWPGNCVQSRPNAPSNAENQRHLAIESLHCFSAI